MTPQRFPQIRNLFEAALERDASERAAFLAEACQGDLELHDEVSRLLDAREATRTLDYSQGDRETRLQRNLGPGSLPRVNDRIDRYRLLSILGEGGMGIVYLAEQERPMKRQVALKLIKPGIASPEAIARFESERQALAVMEHPNIAHVYDAGATEAGQPYFVMEYVPGSSITKYCDQHRLANRDRLELFRHVVLAIHHAHQKGVIHQDIKPSNVLVAEQDGRPVPKVIDFGVAKAIDRRQAGETLFTQRGILAGTPEYMSPEQANLDSRDVDASSDVYSLGVLLYELLVGALPFDSKELRKKGLAEILRIIREESPLPLPSRLKTLPTANEIAQRRDTNPGALRRQLSGELDWITMRAMEKDRQRRYSSAAEFAGDIERYLDNRPVIASPPSRLYRIQKFVSKNRWPVIAAAAVVTALCVGLVASTVLYFRAERERQEAARQREAAQKSGAQAVAGRIEAQRQRDRAEQQTEKASAAATTAHGREKEAQWQSYVANVRAADEHVRAGEFTSAQQNLLLCEPSLRGWEWRYLWSRSDNSIATLYAGGAVHSVGFSRDGSQILLASKNEVDVWSTSTFRRVTSYESFSIKMSPDGSLAMSLDSRRPGELQLKDTASDRVIFKLQAPVSSTSQVVFSLDGSLVAAGFEDASVWIWSTKSGDRLSVLTGLKAPAIALAFSADDSQIAVGSRDGAMRVWDTSSGSLLTTILGQATTIMTAAFSPDGHQLAWGTTDSVRSLELPAGRLTLNFPLPVPLGQPTVGVLTVAFAGDNNRLLVSRTNGLTELRDARTGNLLELLVPAEGGVFDTAEQRATVSPDGKLILVASKPGVIRVLARDSIEQKQIPAQGERVPGPAPDYSSMPPEMALTLALTLSLGPQSFPGTGFTVSVDHIATVSQGRLRLWQTQSVSASKGWNEQAVSGPVRFSADGKYLAAASEGGRITIWNTTTGATVAVLSAPASDVSFLEFSTDGSRIASLGPDKIVHIWDVRSGRKLPDSVASAQLVALDPDGRRVAIMTGSGSSPLRIFEVRSGRLQLSAGAADLQSPFENIPFEQRVTQEGFPPASLTFPAGPSTAFSMTFSPDGKQIAVGGSKSVWLRDTEAGSVVSKFESAYGRLKFTPDGSRLVSLDYYGNIVFGDPNHSDPLLTLNCGRGPAGFDISMDRLVCVTNDGTVHAWSAQSPYYPGARDLAEGLLRKHFLVSEAVKSIEKDNAVAEPLRKAAIGELLARRDDLTGLGNWSGEVVTAATRRHTEYQLALRRIQSAARTPAAERALASRLGEVQYRLGRYNDALESLTRNNSDGLRVAFLAMTYQRLGRSAEAREQLVRFRAQMRPGFSSIPVPQRPSPGTTLARILDEAETLIEGTRTK